MALAPKNPAARKWPVEAACPILVGHPAMMLRLEVQRTVGFWAAFSKLVRDVRYAATR